MNLDAQIVRHLRSSRVPLSLRDLELWTDADQASITEAVQRLVTAGIAEWNESRQVVSACRGGPS